MDYIISSGITSSGLVLNNDYLDVASGGMVGSITNLGGTLDAEDGAILDYVYKGDGKMSSTSTSITVSEDADGGGNNWMFDKKTGEMNNKVTDSEPTSITSDTWEIVVDAEGVSYEDKNGNQYGNYVGYGDAVDFTKIYLENAAKLSLTINATDAAKITVWKLNESWKKNILSYSQKSLQSTKLTLNKKNGVYSTDTKSLLLEAGEYYISVESTNAKKGGNAYYNLELNHDKSAFFTKGNNSDDWTDLKQNGTSSDEFGDAGTISKDTVSVIKDGWVGYGDSVDYMQIHLDEAAKLSFLIDSADAAKFTIYRLNETVKKGAVSYSLKSLQSTTLKKFKGSSEYTATTNSLLLTAGDYYIAMASTNAKKGGNADYNVLINGNGTAFFSDADNGLNNWLYNKKSKELNEDVAFQKALIITRHTERVLIDSEAVNHEDINGTIWDNYVGYGDEYDFAKICLDSDARLNVTITATDAIKFTIYIVRENVDSWSGIVSYKPETLQSAKLKKAKGDSLYRHSVTLMVPGDISYFVAIQSTNAAKGGCAYYNVEINQKQSAFNYYYYDSLNDPVEAHNSDALSMPETNCLIQDVLLTDLNVSFDSSLSDKGAFFDATSEHFFEESGKGILASL